MKLSDYVAQWIAERTDTLFLLSGGGIMHLVDSIGGQDNLHFICCHHEQAAAIAAEGFARVRNKPGVVVVTTGPGGTNAITGVAGAWLDSIPMLVISGQVKRDNMTPKRHGAASLRALGFQELNVLDMVRPITKYSALVDDPQWIRYHLERAWYESCNGRPGPAWLEIPLDVQAVDVEAAQLPSFPLPEKDGAADWRIPVKQIVKALHAARQPLLFAGNGIRLAGAMDELQQFLQQTGINVVTSMFTSDDLVTYHYPGYLGRQGMWGTEGANYAVDNCDLLLIVGSRMQITQTSFDYQHFAAQAQVIMVDVDEAELTKKTLAVDIPVACDAKEFFKVMLGHVSRLQPWRVECRPIDPSLYEPQPGYVNVYRFLEFLSTACADLPVATSDGMASVATHQALKLSRGQRLITNAGLGHMGSGLPLAIGACFAVHRNPVVCMEGDGSIMLNIQELQTLKHHALPIKLFIWNNGGYYSIRGTHERFFNRVYACDPQSGVGIPDFEKLITAWGLPYKRLSADSELVSLAAFMAAKGPGVCEVMIDPKQTLLPRWTAGQLRELGA